MLYGLHVVPLAWIILTCATAVSAAVYHIGPQDGWFSRIGGDRLQPGDEVVLAPGVYRDARRLVVSHCGTAEKPIVIRSSDKGPAVLHRPDARQNSINIVGAQYLVLRDLEITGRSTGVRLMKSAEHLCKFVTLEGMHIHHVGGPAVTANHPGNAYEGLVFRRNHIHHTSGHGEGFYLGSNNNPDGTTAGYVFHCLVEGNYIHDLGGPEVSQGDGIEIKDGTFGNVVCDNVIHDTNYPGVLVYGTDGKAPNVVERNAIWNSNDHGIQAAAGAIIRNNVTFNNQGDGIHSHAHQSARVGNLRIVHNTVVCNQPGTAAVRLSLTSQPRTAGPVTIANNALYAPGDGFSIRVVTEGRPPADVALAGNVGSGEIEGLPAGAGGILRRPAGALTIDLDARFFPRAGSLLFGAGSGDLAAADDFNGTPRNGSHDAGAYIFDPQGNPGRPIGPGFKRLPSESQEE